MYTEEVVTDVSRAPVLSVEQWEGEGSRIMSSTVDSPRVVHNILNSLSIPKTYSPVRHCSQVTACPQNLYSSVRMFYVGMLLVFTSSFSSRNVFECTLRTISESL